MHKSIRFLSFFHKKAACCGCIAGNAARGGGLPEKWGLAELHCGKMQLVTAVFW